MNESLRPARSRLRESANGPFRSDPMRVDTLTCYKASYRAHNLHVEQMRSDERIPATGQIASQGIGQWAVPIGSDASRYVDLLQGFVSRSQPPRRANAER